MRCYSILSLCGTAILVLCVSAFATAQVPVSGLQLWLDGQDLTTSTFSGPSLTTWADKSGNGNHATAASTTVAPVVGSLNGFQAIRFDGVDDGMAINNALSLGRPYTVFIVDQYSPSASVKGRTLQGVDANWLIGKWGGSDAHYVGTFVYNPANGGTTTIGEGNGLPAESNYNVNGNLVGTVYGAPTGSPGRLGLAGVGAYPLEVSQADIGEILVYDRVLTTVERQQVGAYLQSKWGIAGAYNGSVLADVSQGAFSGGDVGEGLDLDGFFQYAVNARGPAAGAVRDATFTADNAPGVTLTAQHEILNWNASNYGGTSNDDNLETVMESIRWSGNPNTVDVALANVTAGQDYRLQLLFADNGASRGFDIFLEGLLAADNFFPGQIQVNAGGVTTNGAVFTVDFFAPDSTLNFQLNGAATNFSDKNPILNGFTLEYFPDAVATTSIPDGGMIDFSTDLVLGPTMETQTITIENTGEANSELVLNDILLAGDPGFSILNDPGDGFILGPGETLDLLVKFDGAGLAFGQYTALLELDTNSGATFGSLDGQNFIFNLSAVNTPEPASLALWVLLSFAAVGWSAARRRKRIA